MQPPPPYRPLRGAQPPHFADREDEDDLGAAGIVASTLAAYRAGVPDPRLARLVYGPPAIGKTALLRAVRREASALGWAVVAFSCRPKQPALPALANAVLARAQWHWPEEIAHWSARRAHPSGRLDLVWEAAPPRSPGAVRRSPAPLEPCLAENTGTWGTLRCLLDLLSQLCLAPGPGGVLVTVDDADRLSTSELTALGHLVRYVRAERCPVAFLLAARAELARRAARAGYYGGALWPTRLAPLGPEEASEALVVPAVERGVEVDDDAVDLACRASGGWPLELQKLGFAAWPLAGRDRAITGARMEAALAWACAPTAQVA